MAASSDIATFIFGEMNRPVRRAIEPWGRGGAPLRVSSEVIRSVSRDVKDSVRVTMGFDGLSVWLELGDELGEDEDDSPE